MSNKEAVARYQKTQKAISGRRRREQSSEYKARKKAYDSSPARIEYVKAYRKTPERLAAERTRNAAESRKQKLKEYQQTDEYKAKMALYAKSPERIAERCAISAMRRARKLSQGCSCCSKEQFKSLYETAQFLGLQVDHVKPLVLGGAHCRKNLQLLTTEQHKVKTREDMKQIRLERRS